MKHEIAIFFCIMILVAIALLVQTGAYKGFSQAPQEKEITIGEFKSIIQNEAMFSVVMYANEDLEKNTPVLNCGIGLSGSLAGMGKNVSAFGLEKDYCIWQDQETQKMRNTTQEICAKEFGKNYYFEVKYGSSSSKFYEKKAVIYVDQNFNSSCSIAVAGAS
jgi:hypothetical protein